MSPVACVMAVCGGLVRVVEAFYTMLLHVSQKRQNPAHLGLDHVSQAARATAGTEHTPSGRQPADERATPEDDCVQRMLRWVTQSHGGNNVTIVASIATLGLVISTGLVACGLAVWLCGVGWRAARGPGAQPSDQPSVGREDSRTRVECSRTRNPQRARAPAWAKLIARTRTTARTRP